MTDLPVWAEIDLGALAGNVREIRRVTPAGTEVMAVVKADAYGHGSVEVSKAALSNGASRLAVARTAEGAELRRAGISAPILVLGYTPAALIREVAENHMEQTVYGYEYAREINNQACRLGVRVGIHIKVDTGMGRIGVVAGSDSGMAEIKKIVALPCLEVVGIYTHFASADSADKSFALDQLNSFLKLLGDLSREGIEFPLKHCANSAAILDLPQSSLNLVRAGIILYGLYPSVEVDSLAVKLRPVMSFRARVAQVKRVPAGFSVSYGCTYVTERETVIATLSVGYADGYSRLLSNTGQVLVKGRRAPVIGRVCMDQCMIDVGDVAGVLPGDEVVLFGSQGEEILPVEEVAERIGTINYEVVCMVSGRVPRVYKNNKY
ncbi:MAG: alanine racemase [Desulfocucumaceae bacterium]